MLAALPDLHHSLGEDQALGRFVAEGGMVDSSDDCGGDAVRELYMRKTGEEPPTRQFPSVEVCESYTSVMFELTALWIHLHRDLLNPEREVYILSTLCAGKIASVTAGATDYKSENPVDVFVMCDFDTHSPCGFPSYTSVPRTYARPSLDTNNPIIISSPPLLVTVHPVRPVQYKSLLARSKCVAEFGTRFVTMGGALHKDDPKYADGLPLPSLPSIKDAYESIRMEVVGNTFEWEVLLDRIHVKESDGLERFWTQLSKRYQGDDRNILHVPPRPASPTAAAKKHLRLLARVQKTGAVVAKADSPFLYGQHIANRITALMKKETTRGQPFSSTEIHQLDPQIYEHGLRSCDFALWRAGSRMAKRETLLARLLRRIHTLSLQILRKSGKLSRRSRSSAITAGSVYHRHPRASSGTAGLNEALTSTDLTGTARELATSLSSVVPRMHAELLPHLRLLYAPQVVPSPGPNDEHVGWERFVEWESRRWLDGWGGEHPHLPSPVLQSRRLCVWTGDVRIEGEHADNAFASSSKAVPDVRAPPLASDRTPPLVAPASTKPLSLTAALPARRFRPSLTAALPTAPRKVSQHLYEEHASPTVPNPRDTPVYERYQDGFARDKTKHIN